MTKETLTCKTLLYQLIKSNNGQLCFWAKQDYLNLIFSKLNKITMFELVLARCGRLIILRFVHQA